MKKSWKFNLILATSFILLGIFLVFSGRKKIQPLDDDKTEDTVIEPTCTEKGYTLSKNLKTGVTTTVNLTDPLGHAFGDPTLEEASDSISPSFETKVCKRCGEEETCSIYPDDGMAKICIYGEIGFITKDLDAPISIKLDCQQTQVESFGAIKNQGHSSMDCEKKNYTIRFFEDELHENKLKLQLGSWSKENKYILKAGYYDQTKARNLVVADIWADMVDTREGADEKLLSLDHNGVVDGFPIAVYHEDVYTGLYTMNLHKDDDLFKIEDDAKEAVAIINYNTSDEALFKALSEFGEKSDWEIEACGTEDTSWAEESVNNLISFVMTSSDEEFKENLKDYMDIEAAVDYLIAIYALGLQDHGTENLLMVTYDGSTWIPSLYDMEDAFGMIDGGKGYYGADEGLPVFENGTWNSKTDSLLWDRFLNLYQKEILQRYRELRSDILKEDLLIDRINTFMRAIPEAYYGADQELYNAKETPAEQKEQICFYINQRLAAVDELWMQ